jgi:nitrite reductase/ring-hydroxylating ferredoxin subunit/uncharacterized membrane protein
MKPVPREVIADRIEQIEALDGPAEKLQELVKKVVPDDSRLKDLLSGTWLGHPVHPMLTDVVVGCWTSAFLLDLVPSRATRAASDRLIGLGLVAGVPTAAAGLSDWADVFGGIRRSGAVHALGNTTALALYSMSYLARKRGHRTQGWVLSMLGYATATFSAYLGGHLSFSRGVGVNQTIFESPPTDWTTALDESQLEEGKPRHARVNGTGVVLVRRGGRIHALGDRCPHRGCGLHGGQVNDDDGTLSCPCHGSTFKLDDGEVMRGPATSPAPSFETRTRDGKVEIRFPSGPAY